MSSLFLSLRFSLLRSRALSTCSSAIAKPSPSSVNYSCYRKKRHISCGTLRLWPGPFLGNFARGVFTGTQEMADDQALAPAIVVYVTVPNKETGKSLATSIISNRLAACVNQVPGIESTYWWEGKVETDSELLLIIKTRQSLLEALTEHVKANHPYEVPEVISLPITGGNEKYLHWLHESTSS